MNNAPRKPFQVIAYRDGGDVVLAEYKLQREAVNRAANLIDCYDEHRRRYGLSAACVVGVRKVAS